MNNQVVYSPAKDSKKKSKELSNIELIDLIVPKKTTLEIIKRIFIKGTEGARAYITDLEVYAKSAPIFSNEKGLYILFNKQLEKDSVCKEEDFPVVEPPSGDFLKINFPKETNWKKLSGCVSVDLMRPALSGIHCKVSGKKLYMESTSGYVLFRQVFDTDVPECDFIIPPSLIKIILKSEYYWPVSASINEEQIVLDYIPNWKIWSKKVIVSFPNVESVFPKEYNHRLEFNRLEMLGALQAVKPYIEKNKNKEPVIRFLVKENKLYLIAKNVEKGFKKYAEVSCRYKFVPATKTKWNEFRGVNLLMPLVIGKYDYYRDKVVGRRFEFNLLYLETMLSNERNDKVVLTYYNNCQAFVINFESI